MQEITYTQAGDCLIPQLSLPETPEKPLSKYGRMRQTYLKEHREVLYNQMLMSGGLSRHLAEIDEAAQSRLEILMREGAKQQGLTEEMKAKDPLRWAGLINNLKAQAEEVILNELVYS